MPSGGPHQRHRLVDHSKSLLVVDCSKILFADFVPAVHRSRNLVVVVDCSKSLVAVGYNKIPVFIMNESIAINVNCSFYIHFKNMALRVFYVSSSDILMIPHPPR